MLDNKKILGIVVARKGSKRLKNKNVLDLQGKPLIEWTFDEVVGSEFIDDVIISTDDEKVIALANQYDRIDAPFVRPEELSNDTASSLDVIIHALDFCEKANRKYDYVMLFQPTSPLRKKEDIDNAIQMLSNENAKAVVSVSPMDHSPLWSNTLPDDLSMKGFIKPEVENKRSQDLPQYYRINGAIYIAEVDYLKEKRGFIGKDTYAYVMPAERSVDIDTKIDLELCKILMNENS